MPLDGLWPEPESHEARVESLAAGLRAEIVDAEAYVGGGSAPESPIPGSALSLPGGESLQHALRTGRPAVLGYVRDGRLILDVRTVSPNDDADLVAAVGRAVEAVDA